MSSPPTQNAVKSIRVTPDVHARLQAIVDRTGCATHSDAVALLLEPTTLRITLTETQRRRWLETARANGQNIAEFVTARVEAAIMYGADPGALRRVHDMVYSLTRAAGIVPQQGSTPGADRQVISPK
jgi:hypothetical protein